MITTNSECQKAVQAIFTPEFHKNLIKYSIARIQKKFNIRYDLERGFRGIMVEDMISDLMLSFLNPEGGRNWNKHEFPDFKDQVFSALDSVISNTIKSELPRAIQTSEIHETHISDLMPEDNYKELLEYALKHLEETGATDEELLLFEPYVVNGMKRKVVAETFGITEQEATNIKKRLERRISNLREKLKTLKL